MKHILIIGAGASGLMAAKLLAERGHKVLVVEGRSRTGGRIHTMEEGFSRPVETGAEFMHGEQPLTKAILKEAALEPTLLEGMRYQIWKDALDRGDLFDQQWEELLKTLGKLSEDTDMHSFLAEHFADHKYSTLRKKVQGFVEGYDAADMHRVSAMALRKEWSEGDDEHQYHIQGGYSGLIRYLEESFRKAGGELRLSCPVHTVKWSEGKVTVICEEDETFDAERAIITIPLGVLQSGRIKFFPALPAHDQALRSMGFGGVIKFFFEFRTSFWEDQTSRSLNDLAFIFSDAVIPTWWTQRPSRLPLLTGWLGGPPTRNFSDSADELSQQAVQSLEYIFKCPASVIRKEISAHRVVNWLQDEFAYGAYAYPTVETDRALAILREPVKNTLYFAGEAMYKGSAIGTVEAALVNGKEVAGLIA